MIRDIVIANGIAVKQTRIWLVLALDSLPSQARVAMTRMSM